MQEVPSRFHMNGTASIRNTSIPRLASHSIVVEHRGEDVRVGVVEVPLVAAERRPHPAPRRPPATQVNEPGARSGNTVADRRARTRRAWSGRGRPGRSPRTPGRRPASPAPTACSRGGVVEHEVDAQAHAALAQCAAAAASRSSIVPSRGSTGAVVHDGVAAVVLARPGLEQRHQVQVGDTQLGEVVELAWADRRASRRTGRRSRRSRPSAPAGTNCGRSPVSGPIPAILRVAPRPPRGLASPTVPEGPGRTPFPAAHRYRQDWYRDGRGRPPPRRGPVGVPSRRSVRAGSVAACRRRGGGRRSPRRQRTRSTTTRKQTG